MSTASLNRTIDSLSCLDHALLKLDGFILLGRGNDDLPVLVGTLPSVEELEVGIECGNPTVQLG